MFLQNTIRIIAYVGSVYINEEGGEWQIQKEYTNSWIPSWRGSVHITCVARAGLCPVSGSICGGCAAL